MMRAIGLLILCLLPSVLPAQDLGFVKALSSIDRAPVTTDTLGRLLGVPAFQYLQRPITVGAYGSTVYLFDAGTNIFYRYDRNLETLHELAEISGALKGEPAGITVLPDLSFYVSDPFGHQVIHGSFDGKVLQRFSDQANLSSPVATAFDEMTRNLLVADRQFDHVVGFNHKGWLLFGFGERGEGADQTYAIADMAFGPLGLYLLDHNPFVKIYSPQGKYLDGFLRREVSNPGAIAVDLHDRVYVADTFDDTVKVYVRGKYVGQFGGTGTALGQFRSITDLYVNQYFLYVADSMNSRVQVFLIERLYAEPPHEMGENSPQPHSISEPSQGVPEQ